MNHPHSTPPPEGKKIFISYAHATPGRKESVANLVTLLRSKRLLVSVDMDVKTLHGPDEGWIKWMKRQLNEADWVLVYFDEVYRRRFDGEEELNMGHGSTWEGMLITAELYRQHARNKKFVPLLEDDASPKLIPAELFDFNHYYIQRQSEELAQRLVEACTAASSVPAEPRPARSLSAREKVLWRFAYSFLRLDQLASGGWGKSLAQWMEAIWQGDSGTILRTPEMRKLGGTDFTCGCFSNYVQFVERILDSRLLAAFARATPVPIKLVANVKQRIDPDGEGVSGRRVPAKVNIRHTAMGMQALLLCGKPRGFRLLSQDELRLTAAYLINHLQEWRKDGSYVFGMFAALSKLAELIAGPDGIREFQGVEADRKKLAEAIETALGEIENSLINVQEYKPLPPGSHEPLPPASHRDALTGHFFVPYGKYWRMERSGFLMYLPLLISEDGLSFLPHVERNPNLKDRLFNCLHELLEEIQTPFDAANPKLSLMRYHRADGTRATPRDWGLSAQLARALHYPAVEALLLGDFDYYNAASLSVLRSTLEEALTATLDEFHRSPGIFKFTQSLSFSSILGLLQSRPILPDELLGLDHAITQLLGVGVTEESLDAFVKTQIVGPNANSEEPPANVTSLRDLLLDKLEPGEHTEDHTRLSGKTWNQVKRDTIEFYDGKAGDDYVDRYGRDPVVNFVSRLDDFFDGKELNGMNALDLACGPGQYAQLLQKKGLNVELYDASRKMLRSAARRLGISEVPEPKDYYDLERSCPDERYDLVFASAMMVHVPSRDAAAMYRQMFRILKPGGVLFINFKIGDHSLISLGGRYYEYYRDREQPRCKMEAAGFQIVEIIERWNHQTLQNTPRKIHWVNFFFRKPEPPA